MKLFQKTLFLCVAASLSAFSSSVEEEEKENFKGNWICCVQLKTKEWAIHESKRVSIGSLGNSKYIYLLAPDLNGVPMNPDGLYIKVNSTKEEFLEALVQSGLYDPEMS